MQRICIHRVRTQTLTFNHIHTRTHTRARAITHTWPNCVLIWTKCANPCWKSRVCNFKVYNKIITRFLLLYSCCFIFFGRMEGLLCLGSQARVMMNMTADWWTFVFNVLPLNSDENVLSSRELLYLKLLEALWFRFFSVGYVTWIPII